MQINIKSTLQYMQPMSIPQQFGSQMVWFHTVEKVFEILRDSHGLSPEVLNTVWEDYEVRGGPGMPARMRWRIWSTCGPPPSKVPMLARWWAPDPRVDMDPPWP